MGEVFHHLLLLGGLGFAVWLGRRYWEISRRRRLWTQSRWILLARHYFHGLWSLVMVSEFLVIPMSPTWWVQWECQELVARGRETCWSGGLGKFLFLCCKERNVGWIENNSANKICGKMLSRMPVCESHVLCNIAFETMF